VGTAAAAQPAGQTHRRGAGCGGAGPGWKEIQQVAILIQENRSSRHYFGTMSAVRGSSVRPCPGNIWAALIRRSGPPSCCSSITRLSRPAQADGVLRAAARLRAPAAHRLGDRSRSSALSAPATTARATATAEGRSGPAALTNADNLLGRVRTYDAGVPAGCCPAGGGRECCRDGLVAVIVGTRTVTSYRLGGSFMRGLVSEVSDISGLC
jgi:hypothetical protein